MVNLEKTDNISIGNLAAQVPTESARYHLFRFQHTHEGDYTESIGKHRRGSRFYLLIGTNVVYDIEN